MDIVILNSFMDLCVRYSMAERAIEVYELAQSSDLSIILDNSSVENADCTLDLSMDYDGSHNVSIQIGILIKAYG
jgi:pentatricopeptide repeat protein